MNPRTAFLSTRLMTGLLLLSGAKILCAAEISVTTVQDAVLLDGRCSLREAISNANLDQSLINGQGECAAGSGPDLITLGPGTYAITRSGAGEDQNAMGDFDLRSSITIVGVSPSATRLSGGLLDRVLHVAGSGLQVSLRQLSISFGVAPDGVTDVQRGGGGMFASGNSTTTLEHVVVELNSGGSGTAAGLSPGNGGGLLCEDNGRLVVRDSIVRLNSAGNARAGGSVAGGGGGIFGLACIIDIERSRIEDNVSGDGVGNLNPGDGGGIGIYIGELNIVDSVIARNTVGTNGSAGGGGIAVTDVFVDMQSSSLIGNRATIGGGIASRRGPLVIGIRLTTRNSTFSGNAATSGAAVWMTEYGALRLRASTVADNVASDGGAIAAQDCPAETCVLRYANSVFLRNTGGDCALDGFFGESDGFNALADIRGCGLDQPSDRVVPSTALEPLNAAYGGTPVHLPAIDSALIDGGSCNVAGTRVDQAGTARPQQFAAADADDGCDIGAIERRPDFLFADGFE